MIYNTTIFIRDAERVETCQVNNVNHWCEVYGKNGSRIAFPVSTATQAEILKQAFQEVIALESKQDNSHE